MKCDRCGNAMAYEQFFGNQEHFWGWRCVFCGEIVDDVIMENRQWLKKGVVFRSKKVQSNPAEKVKEGTLLPILLKSVSGSNLPHSHHAFLPNPAVSGRRCQVELSINNSVDLFKAGFR